MVALSTLYKSMCRYALGYGAGTPAGDRARLEQAMNEIEDDYMLERVKYHIERVLDAIDDSAPDTDKIGADPTDLSYRELITGDINRSVIRYENERSGKKYDKIGLEAQLLADLLFVPNYRDPTTYYQRFYADGGTYIRAVPGPAATSVGSRLSLSAAYG